MNDLESLRAHNMGITTIRQTDGNRYAIGITTTGLRKDKESTMYHYLSFEIIVENLSDIVIEAIATKAKVLSSFA